jgi:hypothetical protein
VSKAKEFTLDLGGEQVGLRFDFNALATVEELTGRNLVVEGLKDPSITDLRALIYACSVAWCDAHKEECRYDLKAIGGMLDMDTVTQAWSTLQALTTANMPEQRGPAGVGEENPPEAPEGA